MAEPNIRQLQYESDTWKRQLGFMTDENIHLKNRLAEILREPTTGELLETAEQFQNHLIEEDQAIALLRRSISDFDKLLAREVFENGKIRHEIDRKLKGLRDEMRVAERKSNAVKSDFNTYFSLRGWP